MPSKNFVHIAKKQDIKETNADHWTDDKEPKQHAKRDTNHKTKRVNIAEVKRNKRQSESEESSYDSNEKEKEKKRMWKMRAASEHQII